MNPLLGIWARSTRWRRFSRATKITSPSPSSLRSYDDAQIRVAMVQHGSQSARRQQSRKVHRPSFIAATPATINNSADGKVGAAETLGVPRKSTRLCGGMGIAAVAAVVGLVGFPQTEAFLPAGPCLLSGATRALIVGRKAGDCRGRVKGVRMSSEGQRE